MEECGRFRDTTLVRIRQPDRTGDAPLPVAHEKAVGLSFGVKARFLPEARKKSRLHGRGCIFSRSPIVHVAAFRLVFGAVLLFPQQLGPPAPRPAFEDMAVVARPV
jgi:hypothetical protein